MTIYRYALHAVDPELSEWIPQSTLDDVVRAVEADADLQAYIKERCAHAKDVAPYNATDLYIALTAIVFAIKTVWTAVEFSDKVANLVLDHNAKLALAEKIVLRLRQSGLEYPASEVEQWIDKILDAHTKPE